MTPHYRYIDQISIDDNLILPSRPHYSTRRYAVWINEQMNRLLALLQELFMFIMLFIKNLTM